MSQGACSLRLNPSFFVESQQEHAQPRGGSLRSARTANLQIPKREVSEPDPDASARESETPAWNRPLLTGWVTVETAGVSDTATRDARGLLKPRRHADVQRLAKHLRIQTAPYFNAKTRRARKLAKKVHSLGRPRTPRHVPGRSPIGTSFFCESPRPWRLCVETSPPRSLRLSREDQSRVREGHAAAATRLADVSHTSFTLLGKPAMPPGHSRVTTIR